MLLVRRAECRQRQFPLANRELCRLDARRAAARRPGEHSQLVAARLQQLPIRPVTRDPEGISAREEIAEPGEQAEPLAGCGAELDVEPEHRYDLGAPPIRHDPARAEQDDRRLLLGRLEGAPREREWAEQARR